MPSLQCPLWVRNGRKRPPQFKVAFGGEADIGLITALFLGTGLSSDGSQPFTDAVCPPRAATVSGLLQNSLAVCFALFGVAAYIRLRRQV